MYYSASSSKKDGLTPEEINSRWKKLAKAKRDKVTAEHTQLLSDFNANFETFIRVNINIVQLKLDDPKYIYLYLLNYL